MKLVVLYIVLTLSLVTGAFWSPYSYNHRHEVVVKEGHKVVVEFEEERNGKTKVLISQHEDSDSGVGVYAAGGFTRSKEFIGEWKKKLVNAFWKTKNEVSEKTHEASTKVRSFEQQSKEVVDEAVGGVGDPKEKLSEKISENLKSVGEKAKSVAQNARSVVGKTIGMVGFGDSTEGTLKDSVVKMENWDPVDSPKRIGEDIERNASRKFEQGVEEVKETVEIVKETSLNDLSSKSKKIIREILVKVSLKKIRAIISWCHLLGFSTAYGMGVWVTFFSSCILRKSLPKQQYGMVLSKMNMVYFKAMGYCVGGALLGYLVSQGRKGFFSNKMEVFQGFNLLYALVMILINLMFLEPRANKLIVERTKMEEGRGGRTTGSRTKSVALDKLKKLNTYSSTLNVSTMVVLTWHLAYIGRLLQARG